MSGLKGGRRVNVEEEEVEEEGVRGRQTSGKRARGREGRSRLLRGRKEKAIDRLPSKISYWISLTETTAF